ncbi:polysaccharide biosynthesis protein [Gorillibacterium sp. sgz5001074]|uniref:polysaccharide biosynthesis protein n=1 Tax=Gorillibacterium sp. sgz5001074 TaxID=3446695 RepID=UPI003F66CB35
MFKGKRILITGGTGSWGHELVKQLLEKEPEEVVVYSRNESGQVAMKRHFDDKRLKFVIGDIRDKEALKDACAGMHYVYHLAALKHVPVCEEQPLEALKTNVTGTQNVIEAAIENKVEKCIYISTDKAANPSNFYGMTKAIGEKLIVQANQLRTDTKFITVRGGNVLGTNGSVIHLFVKQIMENQEIGITDLEMTRFFLTIQDAITLLFKASEEAVGGEIFVMVMPTCKIMDLADVLAEELGAKDIRVKELGVRPGEKIHEILYSEYESANTVQYDHEYLVILPTIDIPGLKEAYAKYPKVTKPLYVSSDGLMSKAEIRELLVKGRFLP